VKSDTSGKARGLKMRAAQSGCRCLFASRTIRRVDDSRKCQTLRVPRQSRVFTLLIINPGAILAMYFAERGRCPARFVNHARWGEEMLDSAVAKCLSFLCGHWTGSPKPSYSAGLTDEPASHWTENKMASSRPRRRAFNCGGYFGPANARSNFAHWFIS
jgi:hypothetical protein